MTMTDDARELNERTNSGSEGKSDILHRLRLGYVADAHDGGNCQRCIERREAADEIERLRDALQEIATTTDASTFPTADPTRLRAIAQEALAGE